MNLGLRSYIYISKAELVWLHHEKPKIVYTIRNGGKIPATIIGMYEDFRIIKQMPEKVEFGAAAKKSIPVAPGSDQTGNTSHTRISLSAEEIEQINSGDAYLYLLIELAALSFGLFGAYLVGNGRMFWGYLVIVLAAFIFATDLGTFAFGSPTNVWGLAWLWCNAAGA